MKRMYGSAILCAALVFAVDASGVAQKKGMGPGNCCMGKGGMSCPMNGMGMGSSYLSLVFCFMLLGKMG